MPRKICCLCNIFIESNKPKHRVGTQSFLDVFKGYVGENWTNYSLNNDVLCNRCHLKVPILIIYK